MNVKSYNNVVNTFVPASIAVIDVVLMEDNENPEHLYSFYCPLCNDPNRKALLQHMGKVILIAPGHAPLKMPIIKRCVKCKHNFSFNVIV